MFFSLSKFLWAAASPTNIVIGLSVLGAVLLATRWKYLGRRLALAGALGLALLAISPLPRVMLRPLEDRFPVVGDAGRGPIIGIIVLGGALGISRGQIVLTSAASRLSAAAALARKHPEAKLIFTGGNAIPNATPEAKVAGAVFRLFDIPAERLVLEDRARNTRENALFTRDLVKPKPGERWLLVTSAFHMPRAIGCFRAVGLELEPYPVEFMTSADPRHDLWPLGGFLSGVEMAEKASKEWAGLVVYRLAGYTTEFFPAPHRDYRE